MEFSSILILSQSIFGCKQAEPEPYLFLERFRGRSNIIFNQENGAAPKYSIGRGVYEISISGILLKRFRDQDGLVGNVAN